MVVTHPDTCPLVSDVARAMRMTERTLRRRWRLYRLDAVADVHTLRQEIIRARVEFAAERIAKGEKIMAARTEAGFKDTSNFNKQFRRYVGCGPEEFRWRGTTVQASDPARR
jgi:AraC-like DNA-binding protein